LTGKPLAIGALLAGFRRQMKPRAADLRVRRGGVMNKSAFAARETELIILGRPPVTGEPSGRLMRLLARDFFATLTLSPSFPHRGPRGFEAGPMSPT
jgi:hypothetical protein